jgi:hypothetical protein
MRETVRPANRKVGAGRVFDMVGSLKSPAAEKKMQGCGIAGRLGERQYGEIDLLNKQA